MKAINFILAVISFILVLVLAVFGYNMNSRLDALTGAQGAGQTHISSDMAKLRGDAKQQSEDTSKALDAVKAEVGQNKEAIDDMKMRINRLIDLIK